MWKCHNCEIINRNKRQCCKRCGASRKDDKHRRGRESGN